MMDLAARLALRGLGSVEPNPMVGCVIAHAGGAGGGGGKGIEAHRSSSPRDGGDTQGDGGGPRILGLGHHRAFGGPHAEIDALESCRRQGANPAGATAWVTLEPCGHRGKTPPCAEALIAAGVREVVYARADPNPAHAGAAALREAGIQVRQSDASAAATALTEPFVKRATTGLPWIICKWAQTIDGRIATRAGMSKWISGAPARARVHRLRGRIDAIITGLGTAIADDPMLTARGPRAPQRVAHRVVIDPELGLSLDSALVRTAKQIPLVVVCGSAATNGAESDRAQASTARPPGAARAALVEAGATIIEAPWADDGGLDLRAAMKRLAERCNITTAMVEAGPGLVGSLLEQDLADALLVYIAPIVLADTSAIGPAGGRTAPNLTDARRFQLLRTRIVGDDVELLYHRDRATDAAGRP